MEKQQAHDESRAVPSYQKPELTRYGSIAFLTLASGSANGDAGQNMMTRTSDLHYKQNIVRIGTHPFGFGLYLFDYKPEFQQHGAGRQFGVMAQEVEQVMPEAVTIDENGYRQVNYALLGISHTRH